MTIIRISLARRVFLSRVVHSGEDASDGPPQRGHSGFAEGISDLDRLATWPQGMTSWTVIKSWEQQSTPPRAYKPSVLTTLAYNPTFDHLHRYRQHVLRRSDVRNIVPAS